MNAIQDAAAAADDATQVFKTGEIHVGETGLSIVRYATGVMRLQGGLRVDNGLRAGVFQLPVYTNSQRNALASGLAPQGTLIYNSDEDAIQVNVGTDTSRNWNSIGVPNSASAQLTSDVTMATGGTFYGGPAVTIGAGTWMLAATLTVDPGAANDDIVIQIYDGTNVLVATQTRAPANVPVSLSVNEIVAPTTSTTYTARAASTSNGGAIKATPTALATGSTNKASTIIAGKIGQ